jgi:hypothetical protein
VSRKITVESLSDSTYRVTVEEGRTRSTHEVTVTQEHVRRYGHGASPDRLLKASFEFLLQRESKESILSRFSLPDIERYFPDYPSAIGKML